MKSKPKKGKWIVMLERLTKCFNCNSYFTNSKDYEEHFEEHWNEILIKVEDGQDTSEKLQNSNKCDTESISSSDETKKKIRSQSNHFKHQKGKINDFKKCDGILKERGTIVKKVGLREKNYKIVRNIGGMNFQ